MLQLHKPRLSPSTWCCCSSLWPWLGVTVAVRGDGPGLTRRLRGARQALEHDTEKSQLATTQWHGSSGLPPASRVRNRSPTGCLSTRRSAGSLPPRLKDSLSHLESHQHSKGEFSSPLRHEGEPMGGGARCPKGVLECPGLKWRHGSMGAIHWEDDVHPRGPYHRTRSLVL